ncbi:MAG: tetratricopeptide repeat protein [Bryobacteraceae bacterium]
MDPGQVQEQLSRIVANELFAGSRRMIRFLEFTVGEALAGRGAELKETLVGASVFDRPVDYDPRIDPIVRVEARRLRAKLESYYAGAGSGDPVRIHYPRGGYAPTFEIREEGARATAAPAARTIAILPFANLSPDPEHAFFGDGLAQELIHALTRVPDLRVMAWSTAARLREQGAPGPREAAERLQAERLQVDAVVEGSVRRAGKRVRITAGLVDSKSGVYLWTGAYERELADLFAVQEELARSIATILEVRLAPPSRVESVETYSLYLRGRVAWNRRTEEGLRQSIVFYQRAAQADPRSGLAYAGLADAYSLLCDFGFEPSVKVIPLAREAAMRALELDESLAEAHVSLGFVVSMHGWNWDLGEEHYRRAIRLNPGYVTAHHWYGCDLLALRGRHEEALREMEIAVQLSPLEPSIGETAGYIHMLARRYDEAERAFAVLLEKCPDYYKSHTGLGRVLAAQGRYEEAIGHLERGRALAGDLPSILGALCQIRGMKGDRSEAERLLAQLSGLARHRHVSGVVFGLANAGLGRRDEALGWLEKACEQRETSVTHIGVHPAYDSLRNEARFETMLRRVGLRQ